MQKKKVAKLGGFIGALCVSGALVGMGVSGTGAYFSDSHDGSISSTTGTLKVDITGSTNLSFNDLLPGEYKQQTISYTADTTGAEDIWLVFPTSDSTPGDNPSKFFTSVPVQNSPYPLGRYGHLQVQSTEGGYFNSFNLAADPSGGAGCQDAYGHGGSDQHAAANSTDYSNGYCAPIKPILLAQNVTNGHFGQATFTFGYTPILKADSLQGQAGPSAAFKIVATQHGIAPGDPNSSN